MGFFLSKEWFVGFFPCPGRHFIQPAIINSNRCHYSSAGWRGGKEKGKNISTEIGIPVFPPLQSGGAGGIFQRHSPLAAAESFK
jgi:hypothetical protein